MEEEEQRLERLTALARKVFGEDLADRIAPIEYHEGEAPSGMHTALVRLHGRWGELASVKHPRALDALEAALLVLDLSPERAQRLLRGMRTYRDCPCHKCEQDRAQQLGPTKET